MIDRNTNGNKNKSKSSSLKELLIRISKALFIFILNLEGETLFALYDILASFSRRKNVKMKKLPIGVGVWKK